jgi:deazaflavin-dependent oxidoreductase (nitroreductase family)
MTRRPNAFQKLIHRFLMLRPVTAFFAPWIHQLDKAVLKLTNGNYTVAEMIGWNVIQLTTTGAKTGQPRTMPLIGLFDGEKIALIASSFGRKHNPAWYYNLKAHPECKVQSGKRTGTYLARETQGEEYEKYWQMGVSYYEGYEKYQERAAHRHIPVMVLEPKKLG